MPKASAPARISRPVPDLVEALRRHVEFLRKYARWAFEDGDPAFLGEVAGKLRLLVLERGRNAPLLLYLLDEFEMDIEVSMRPPFSPSTLCLDDYLDSLAFAGQISKGYARLSNNDVIAAWSQQTGAAHEDWELAEDFARFAFSGVRRPSPGLRGNVAQHHKGCPERRRHVPCGGHARAPNRPSEKQRDDGQEKLSASWANAAVVDCRGHQAAELRRYEDQTLSRPKETQHALD
jgi:hypothetical protein